MQSSSPYDFAIIGGGSAGYAAARTATELGLKTILVEGGEEIGGLCILRGCMPSKTLIESGNRFMALRHAGEFGLQTGEIAFDGHAIIARKKRLIGEFADYRRQQLETGNFEFLRGHAAFTDSNTLRVQTRDGSERALTARSFLIATGSVLNSPPIPGIETAGCLSSDDVLDLEEIPSAIIVLGAGPVALEMAHYFNALGKKVSVIQRGNQLLTGSDPDLAAVVETAFQNRGMEIFTETTLLRIEREGDTRRVTFEHNGSEKTLSAPAVLNALGRRPATGSLGLEAAGVTLARATIETSSTQQTTASHIFAAGDCSGPFEVVHIAITQGEIAARNAARMLRNESPLETIDYRLKLYAVFTEPQVAMVGISEREAKEKGLDILTASYPFNDHGKSLVMDETAGFVKLIVDASSREILGGAVVGPHASELIHEIVVAMRFHATAGQFAAIPHYHPTLSEIWSYPAEDLAEAGNS